MPCVTSACRPGPQGRLSARLLSAAPGHFLLGRVFHADAVKWLCVPTHPVGAKEEGRGWFFSSLGLAWFHLQMQKQRLILLVPSAVRGDLKPRSYIQYLVCENQEKAEGCRGKCITLRGLLSWGQRSPFADVFGTAFSWISASTQLLTTSARFITRIVRANLSIPIQRPTLLPRNPRSRLNAFLDACKMQAWFQEFINVCI